ncbi:TonB-dependent siderophore receptor [Aquipseudomonas ullengensis]|uniref:TonB-dependent siderophore receptor n=1 Tax=Aquipseudomonas ullengensis TaxID=2759166 RepID=A0A7W4QAM8_9GAMM|nr:TonB-dependent siderophore receptor [Pseudomonas ullengensis]MBB2496022.1 TonB-dependent siderophore receptor [Pseudomonas ullengensis]
MEQQSKNRARVPFSRARLPLAMACALAAMSFAAQAAEQAKALELDATNISGELDSPVGEDQGYVAKNSRSATKINTPLSDTPRSVSVVTQAQMDDRNVQTISQALQYSAGVQAGFYGEDNKQDWFIIRGFKQANNGLFMDGSRIYSSAFYSWQIDPYMLERIEVLKGAASVLYGQTPPGGLINLQSKRPTLDAKNEVGVQYGSFDRKQINADVGGKLDEEGNVLYRVVALSRDTGTQVDDVDAARILLAPSMTLDFNEDTSLTLLASMQKDRSDPQLQFLPPSGTISHNPNGDIDTDTAVGDPSYETFERDQYTLGYELNHRINDNWDFQQNLRYGHMDLELRQLFYYFNITDSVIGRGLTYNDGKADNLSVDNRLLGNWIGDGWENTLLLGADYQQLKINDRSPNGYPNLGVIPTLDIYNPVYGLPIGNNFAVEDKDTRADQMGYYVQEQLKLDNHWVFLLGGRFDNSRTDFDNQTTGVKQNVRDDDFTWSGGAAYIFDNGVTAYASYSEFFLPVTDLNAVTGKPFKPEEGDQKEIGLKYQPVGIDAMFTAAVFELTQQNVKKNLATPSGSVPTQLGEVRSRGIELEAQANLTESLSVIASYTKLAPETTESTNQAEEDNVPANVADELASVWANYKIQGGALNGLAFGAGVRHTSSSYGDNTETLEVPSYTLLDAMVSYQLQDVRLQLNANNVTDKEYVAACDYYCWYGNRRNIIASVSYDF